MYQYSRATSGMVQAPMRRFQPICARILILNDATQVNWSASRTNKCNFMMTEAGFRCIYISA